MIHPNPHLSTIARDNERQPSRDGYLRLDRNERISPMPDAVFKAIVNQLTPETFSSYPCYPPLYERLARATGLSESQLLVTPGSDGAIRRLLQVFLTPGDRVLMAEPTYAMYPIYAQIFQAVVTSVSYNNDLKLNVDQFVDAIRPGLRIVALVNPAQPTGSKLGIEEIEQIVKATREAGAICLIDEAYGAFTDETAMELVPRWDNLVVTRSYSKIGGIAGLRLGFAATHPEIVSAMEKVRGASEVNAIAVLVGCYLLDHPEIMSDFRRAVSFGRQIVIKTASLLGLETPECHGNFQLIRATKGFTPNQLRLALAERHVLVKAGFPPPISDCLRVTLDEPSIMHPFAYALENAVKEIRTSIGV